MTDQKSDWLCCFLVHVGQARLADPYCIGPFEFTRRPEWSENAERALRTSVESFGLDPDRGFVRVRFVLSDETASKVASRGRLHAEEAAGLLPLSTFLFVRPAAPVAGYGMDLKSGTVQPFLAPRHDATDYALFQIDEVATREKAAIDLILGAQAELTGEIGTRLRRSVHWHRRALETEDLASRMLNLWIAAECLCRVHKEEALTPKFLAGLGMPEGRLLEQLRPQARAEFGNDKARIGPWRSKLKTIFGKAAKPLRDGIAHEGARELEIRAHLAEGDAEVMLRALGLLVPQLHSIALLAVNQHMSALAELWDAFGSLFEQLSPGRPVTEHTIGRVIYALNNA